MDTGNTIKIGILDDHPMITSGLKSLLEQDQSMVVSFVLSGVEQIDQALESQPIDILMLDVVVPGVAGLEMFARLRKRMPELAIIAYSSLTSTILVQNLLALGVRGYINKKQEPWEVMLGVQRVLSGAVYVPPDYRYLIQQKTLEQEQVNLSEREVEVLKLIVAGYITKEIAERLFISKNTVDNHRASLFRKFDVQNLAELIRQATNLGY